MKYKYIAIKEFFKRKTNILFKVSYRYMNPLHPSSCFKEMVHMLSNDITKCFISFLIVFMVTFLDVKFKWFVTFNLP